MVGIAQQNEDGILLGWAGQKTGRFQKVSCFLYSGSMYNAFFMN